MRNFVILVLISFLGSCCAQKEVLKDENIDTNPTTEESTISGKVYISSEGCPFYIIAIEEGKEVKMYPVNLEESFKKNGIKIKFSYNLSRAMQPSNCQVDKVVSVSNVKLQR